MRALRGSQEDEHQKGGDRRNRTVRIATASGFRGVNNGGCVMLSRRGAVRRNSCDLKRNAKATTGPSFNTGIGLGVLLAAAVVLGALLSDARWAQAQSGRGSWQSEGDTVRHVVITLNKSRTFRLDKSFSTAVVGAPD